MLKKILIAVVSIFCLYFMWNNIVNKFTSEYPLENQIKYKEEYAMQFNKKLDEKQQSFFESVVKNYNENMTEIRHNNIKKKLNSEKDYEKVKRTIQVIENKLLKNNLNLTEQEQSDLIYLGDKNIWKYLYRLQAPILYY